MLDNLNFNQLQIQILIKSFVFNCYNLNFNFVIPMKRGTSTKKAEGAVGKYKSPQVVKVQPGQPSSHGLNKDLQRNEERVSDFNAGDQHFQEKTEQTVETQDQVKVEEKPVSETQNQENVQQTLNQIIPKIEVLNQGKVINPQIENRPKTIEQQPNCLKSFFTSPITTLKGMSTRNKVILTIILMLVLLGVTAAIVLPLLLPPKTKLNRQEYGVIEFNGVQSPIVSFQDTTDDGRHQYSGHITDQKTSFTHPNTQGQLEVIEGPNKEVLYDFSVPIFSMFETFGNAHKQKYVFEDWLSIYNANPQGMIESLKNMIRTKLSQPNSYKFGNKIPDNLTLVSLTGETMIDIEYDPMEDKFKAAVFLPDTSDPLADQKKEIEKNLNSQNDDEKDLTSNNSNQSTQKLTVDQRLSKVMEETIYYIKRVAVRNIAFLRQKSEEIAAYKKQVSDGKDGEQEWQVTLVKKCQTIQSLLFRCEIDAAEKLVPGLTVQSIKASTIEYVVTEVLNIVFKEVQGQK